MTAPASLGHEAAGAGRVRYQEQERLDPATTARPAQVGPTADPAFRRRVDHVHTLGPRALGELLAEVGGCPHCAGTVARTVERYARLDPAIISALGADHWPAIAPLRLIDGGKP